jgi:hypothetical protein
VSDPAVQFQKLRNLHGSAVLLSEGGKPVVVLPGFTFQSDGHSVTMDLLLRPHAHSGYPTRLFFAEQIEGKGQNWNQHRVVGRNWWAPSWNYVPESMDWPAMLCAHLRAVA